MSLQNTNKISVQEFVLNNNCLSNTRFTHTPCAVPVVARTMQYRSSTRYSAFTFAAFAVA